MQNDPDKETGEQVTNLLQQELTNAVDVTVINQSLDFDPQLIYCPKTGKPIGYRFPGEIKTLLRVHTRERAIELLRTANRTAVSLAWLETNPETLGILLKEDPVSWVVLAFEKLFRLRLGQQYEYRNINQWHEIKVKLHSRITETPLSTVRLVADNLNAIMQLNIKKLDLPWSSFEKLAEDESLYDGSICAKLQHVANKEFIRIDTWQRHIEATSYLARRSIGPSMYRKRLETNVEELIRKMGIAGFELHDNPEAMVAGRYTEEPNKPKYSGKAFTFDGRTPKQNKWAPKQEKPTNAPEPGSFAAMLQANQIKEV